MPLLKLWNSIRGRSAPTPSSEMPSIAPAAAPKKPARGKKTTGRGLFGGGPHAGLRKLVKSVPASSLLEISVGDGSRAVAMLETLEKTQHDVRYLAIDQFELGGGPVSLKQFHQAMRAQGIRPQVFPETIQRGLVRVAHTIGSVDLVIIAAPPEQWHTPTMLPLLARVSHENTRVVYLDGETWKWFQPDAGCGLPKAIQQAAA